MIPSPYGTITLWYNYLMVPLPYGTITLWSDKQTVVDGYPISSIQYILFGEILLVQSAEECQQIICLMN